MERRLAAILALDMVGYTRLMAADESGTIDRQKRHRREVIDPRIAHFSGRIVKTTGDGLLAEFPSVVDAVDCALAFQNELREQEKSVATPQRIEYRAGINLGDIVIDGDDIFGGGVNLAARLESISPAGGLCISDMVRQNLLAAVGSAFQDTGERSLKNIGRKIRVWRWPVAEGSEAVPAERSAESTKEDTRPNIEVRSFQALSSNPDHKFHAEGFAADITTALSKLDALRVVSTTEKYESAGPTPYRVQGNLRVAGTQIRCNIQLLEGPEGHHLWAETFDGSTDDLFSFQDRITQEVVSATEVELLEGHQVRTWRREAGDPVAYGHFLEGRSAYKEYSRTGNARARVAYEAACALSPTFLGALSALAQTHVEDAAWGWSPDRDESLKEARHILDGVFAIDPDHPGAHMQTAQLLMVEGRYREARLEAELSIAYDPNYSDPHACLAHVLNCLSMPEESLRSSRRALRLNPGTPEFYLMPIAEALITLERFEEALAVSEQIVKARPQWIMARVLKVLSLDGLGREKDARETVRSLRDISPGFTTDRWRRSISYPDRPDLPMMVERLIAAGLDAE